MKWKMLKMYLAKFLLFTVVKIQVRVFWVVMLSGVMAG
jgi:hypothetical protein